MMKLQRMVPFLKKWTEELQKIEQRSKSKLEDEKQHEFNQISNFLIFIIITIFVQVEIYFIYMRLYLVIESQLLYYYNVC